MLIIGLGVWLALIVSAAMPQLAGLGQLVMPVWLHVGLGLAVAMRWGWRVWPGLLLGAALAYAHGLSLPLTDALGLSFGDTVAVLAAAALMRRRGGGVLPFFRLSRVLLFLCVGALGLSMATAGWHLLWWSYRLQSGFLAGFPYFMACGMAALTGVLMATPASLYLIVAEPLKLARPLAGRWETALMAVMVTVLAVAQFLLTDSRYGFMAALPSLFIIPLLWMAVRSRLSHAYWLSSLIALLAFAGVAMRNDGYYIDVGNSGVAAASMMLLVQSVSLLVFGALVAERRFAEDWLRRANHQLENKVAERTRQLAESEARLQLMADAAPFPMVMNRLDGGELIYANAQAESLFRHQLSGVDARRVQDFYMNPADREAVTAMLRGEGVVRDHEVRLRTRDGDGFWALISCSVIHSDGELLVISGVNDISERKRLESSLRAANQALQSHVTEIEGLQAGLREQLRRDQLTGLFNRRYLDETLPRLLAHSLALQRPVAVMMVDADHFKRINDNYGHQCGDAVLGALGAYLRDHFRSGDLVCRYGGEEFCILMPGIELEAAAAKAQQLCDAVRELPIVTMEQTLTVTLSIGLAVAPLHGEDTESLVHAADQALYAAKQSGRDRVCVALRHQRALS